VQTANVISHRTLDQLETDLITRARHINAEEYAFLCDLREFDLRQGWKAYHFNNCAEWLNFKCGIVPGTAREKLRVAHAMFWLPRLCQAFADGRLAYSKVRALTRIADEHNEAELVDYALGSTAKQVDDHCRRLRNARRDLSTPDAERLHRERALRCATHGDGSMTISVELPQETGVLVMALEMAAAALARDKHRNEPDDASLFAQQADALVEVARAYLGGLGGAHRGRAGTADNYQVIVQVDESALRDQGGESDLPVETVRRLTWDGCVTPVVVDGSGQPLDVGRKHRVVPPALKRALIARDRHCRYPGCTHERWLDAHHVMHWADGGETSLDNSMLLCSKHHRLLHEGGFTVRRSFDGQWCFRTAEGSVVLIRKQQWGSAGTLDASVPCTAYHGLDLRKLLGGDAFEVAEPA
jgi:hypothetical protein